MKQRRWKPVLLFLAVIFMNLTKELAFSVCFLYIHVSCHL